MLLFVRFARELKRRGATVLVLCQALLKDLLAGVDFIDQVVAEGEPLPAFDVHASMVSLPHLCRTDFDALAAEPPYLRAPADSRIKLGRLDKAKLRIGIYWAAMPGQPQDRQRSAPFAEFLALAGDPELLVFSLQGGVHQKDIQQFGAGGLVHDVGRGIFDFAEAATALSQLDLLISIDAPIAHLGGGDGHEDLGAAAVDRRLALAAGRHRGALVSVGPSVPPAQGRATGTLCSPRCAGELETLKRQSRREVAQSALDRFRRAPLWSRQFSGTDMLDEKVARQNPAQRAHPQWLAAQAGDRRRAARHLRYPEMGPDLGQFPAGAVRVRAHQGGQGGLGRRSAAGNTDKTMARR